MTQPTANAPERLTKLSPQVTRKHTRVNPIDLAELAVLDGKIDSTVLGGPTRYTIDELAEQTGWTRTDLEKLWLWAGLPVPESTDSIYTQHDVDGLTHLRQFSDREQFDEEALSSLVRSLGSSMEHLATWQVEAITQHLAAVRGLNDTEARLEAAAYAPSQGPVLLGQIEKLWLRHYAAAVHRLTTETILRRGVSNDEQKFPLVCAVGFVNIVDFTEHTHNFGVTEYTHFVQDFHDRVADIVNTAGGRIIKDVGDFVIFAAGYAENAAEMSLKLAELRQAGFPADVQVAFVWSRVMSCYGDLYGPGVNFASLLSKQAPVNGILVDPGTAAAFGQQTRYRLVEQPAIEIKGIGEVRPFRLSEK